MFSTEKKVKSDLLDNLYIGAPCSVSWDSMTGDERARACSMCSRKVYNLSDMTKSEANAFLEEHGVSQCVTFYRREDGTIMTDNCPVGLRKLRDQYRLITSMVAASVAFLFSSLSCLAQGTKVPPGQPVLNNQPRNYVKGDPYIPQPLGGSPIAIPTRKPTDADLMMRGGPVLEPQACFTTKKVGEKPGNHETTGKEKYYKLKALFNEMADPTAYNLFIAGQKNFDEGRILVARAYFKASLKAFDPANCDWKLKSLVEQKLKIAEETTPGNIESEEDDAIINIEFNEGKPRIIYTK